jgi:hypothetical protein
MASPRDLAAAVYTDEDVVVVQVLANDPRCSPTQGIVIVGPAGGQTLADLEALPKRLREECGWGAGYEEEIGKRGGGIGADGATILSLVLGVVGTVPTIDMLLERLRRGVPKCPDRAEALETATWAVAMQYQSIERRGLAVTRESRDADHWTFTLRLADALDEFEVEVFGSRSGTVATRVVWTNGDPWGSLPGERPTSPNH